MYDNNELFFKFWRNNVIKNEILFHLRVYNKYLNEIIGLNIYKHSEYRYKSYLNKISVYREYEKIDKEIEQFQYGISEIEFDLDCNQVVIPKGVIPNSVKTIRYGYMCCEPLDINILPLSITSIEFNESFDKPLIENWIPSNIKSLKFGDKFNQPFEDFKTCLPKSLTSIILPDRYKDKHLEIIPKQSSSIIIETSLNNDQNLEYFYNSNENENELYLESNQIPKSITKLTFDDFFDQYIEEGIIPNSVSSIFFGLDFNFSIHTNSLPSNLSTIKFGDAFNQPFNFKTLTNLKTMVFGLHFSQILEDCEFPSNLTCLEFSGFGPGLIPKGYFLDIPLKSLKLGEWFDYVIEDNTLPTTLTLLDLGCSNYLNYFSISLNHLVSLTIGSYFNGEINKDIFPSSLTSLSFGHFFNQRIEVGTLPNSITFLSFSYYYQFDFLIGSLPSSLKTLKIDSNNFTQDLSSSFDDYFTSSLETIYIPKNSILIDILNINFFSKYIRFL